MLYAEVVVAMRIPVRRDVGFMFAATRGTVLPEVKESQKCEE